MSLKFEGHLNWNVTILLKFKCHSNWKTKKIEKVVIQKTLNIASIGQVLILFLLKGEKQLG